MTDDPNRNNALIPYDPNRVEEESRATHGTLPVKIRFHLLDTGDVIEMPANQPILIGRRGSGTRVDLDLTEFQGRDRGISRKHVLIEPSGNRVMIKDLESVNGTRLNRQRLKPLFVYELSNGDLLQIGDLLVKIHFIHLQGLQSGLNNE